MNLTQIIYISRSTFVSTEYTNGIEPNVARILLKSRANNKKNGLVGVLYFGDGCFFQCLEGVTDAVDKLYDTLLKDNRHKDLKILSRKQIESLSFSDWSMKHVPLEDEMKNLLKSQGLKKFDPYKFDENMTNSALELLHSKAGSTDDVLLENVNQQAIKQDIATAPNTESQKNIKKLFLFGLFALALLTIFILIKMI